VWGNGPVHFLWTLASPPLGLVPTPQERDVAAAMAVFRQNPEWSEDYRTPFEAASNESLSNETVQYLCAIATEVQYAVEDETASLKERSRAAAQAVMRYGGDDDYLTRVVRDLFLHQNVPDLERLVGNTAAQVMRDVLIYLEKKSVLQLVP
jgi:hypothetical protein